MACGEVSFMRELLLKVRFAGPAGAMRANVAVLVRIGTGAVLLAFGAGKFTSHGSEVASFHTYGLPAPDAFVYVIGVVEIAGGTLLVLGLATRAASVLLAADMVGAITVSGLGRGEMISLTLAPVLLMAVVFLLWSGPGRLAIDRRLAARGRGRSTQAHLECSPPLGGGPHT
jgi:uncharacterized membrane protein YphA (DoxX/SURF4 family)